MTPQEFNAVIESLKRSKLYICVAELDGPLGIAVRGNSKKIIAQAISLIITSSERLGSFRATVSGIRAAADTLNRVADLMLIEEKEKAPEAAATAPGAEK